MLIQLKEGMVVAGPGVQALGRGFFEFPEELGQALVEAGHGTKAQTVHIPETTEASDDAAEAATESPDGESTEQGSEDAEDASDPAQAKPRRRRGKSS